jgi:hypothetical protein
VTPFRSGRSRGRPGSQIPLPHLPESVYIKGDSPPFLLSILGLPHSSLLAMAAPREISPNLLAPRAGSVPVASAPVAVPPSTPAGPAPVTSALVAEPPSTPPSRSDSGALSTSPMVIDEDEHRSIVSLRDRLAEPPVDGGGEQGVSGAEDPVAPSTNIVVVRWSLLMC